MPGFAGIAGPDLLDWAPDPRVAMAVGKTLAIGRQKRGSGSSRYAELTMKDPNCPQTWARRNDNDEPGIRRRVMYLGDAYPTFE